MVDKSSNNRRTVVKGIAGLLGGGLAATYFVNSSSSALATSFTANPDTITTADGTISDVTLNPDVTLSWQGTDSNPTRANITVKVQSAQLNAGLEAIYTKTGLAIDAANQTKSNSQGFASAFSEKSVPTNHTGIAVSDFEETADGASKDTTITVKVEASIEDSGGTTLASTTSKADYTVTVNNEAASVSASGTAGGNVTA